MTEMLHPLRASLSAPCQTPPVQLTWLGPVRMLVMTAIAFGYASTMPLGPNQAEALRTFGYDPSWYGISILFMISGFLALGSLDRHGSPVKFLRSRLGRNLPILVIFALMVILLAYPLFGIPLDTTAADSSRLELHLQYFFKVISCVDPNQLTPGLLDNALYMCVIQGGLWTFRWGVIAFILTAILWALGGLKNAKTLLILTIMSVICYAGLMLYGGKLSASSPIFDLTAVGLRLGWAYLMGMCAYAYREKLPRNMLVPSVFIFAAALQYYAMPWTPLIEITAEIGIGYFVYLGMTSQRKSPNWLKSLPDLSLGIYVFNWPAAQISLLLLPALSPLELFAVSFPITLLLAYVSWAGFSRPINLRLSTPLRLNAQRGL